MEETICSEEPARSVSGAEALISKHSQHKAEIDTRDESVAQVAKAGRKLIQQSHYASTEVCFDNVYLLWGGRMTLKLCSQLRASVYIRNTCF